MDVDYIRQIDQDRLMQLILFNNGGPYYNAISSFNRAIRTGIEKVILEHGNITRSYGNTTLSLSFSNYEFVKPMMPGNTPMYPIYAQQNKKTYAGMIKARLNIAMYYGKKLMHDDYHDIDLTDIPVPILSNGCNLSSNSYKSPDIPVKHLESVMHAIQEHPGDLTTLDLGIYIIDGNLYAAKSLKDMNTNTLFSNVQEYANPRHEKYVMKSNMLCEAKRKNSVNLVMTITPSRDDSLSFIWRINSPPIDKISMPFVVMFYLIGVFDHAAIIEFVMMHVQSVYRDKVRTILLMFIQNSELSHIRCFTHLKTWLNSLCIEEDIIAILSRRIGIADISKDKILNAFQSQYLPHISGEDIVHNKINLTGSLVAEKIVRYIRIQPARTLQEAKAINNRGRQSFEAARVDTAMKIFTSRLTRGLYAHAIKPIVTMFKRELEAAQGSIKILKKIITAADAAKIIHYHDLRKHMISPKIDRTNILGRKISDEHLKIIGGLRGIMGMTTITTCIDMFRKYNKEGSNNEMRHSGSDSVGIICPLSTGEGRPGQIRLPTMNMQYSKLEADKTDILRVLKERIEFCDHQECTIVVFDTRKLGHVCNIRRIIKLISDIRREIPSFRYISPYLDDMNKFNINYRSDHPFVPVLPVYNNYDEYLSSKGKVTFRSWLKMTNELAQQFIAGKIEYQDLINAGAIEFISADQTSISYIAPSLEEYYENKNNLFKMYDFVFFRSSYYSLYIMRNPSAHKAPVQRAMFGSSQLKSAGSRSAASKIMIKKSTTIPSTQEPVFGNITSFIQPATFNLMTCYIGDPAAQEEGSTIDGYAVSSGLAAEYCNDMIVHVVSNGEQLLMKKDIPNCPKYIDTNGLPKIGTELKYGDPVIFIGSPQKGTNIMKVTYKFFIIGHVTGYRITPQTNNKLNVAVKFTNVLHLLQSSKIAHTTGNKSIVSHVKSPNDMPAFQNGVPVTVILPLSISVKRFIFDYKFNANGWSTVATGQQVYYPVHSGDITVGCPKDFMKRWGMVGHGSFKLVTQTGAIAEHSTHVGIVATQRLEKFGQHESHATTTPRYNDSTRQPYRDGKNRGGAYANPEMNRIITHNTDAANFDADLQSDTIVLRKCADCGNDVINHRKNGMMCIHCASQNHNNITSSYATVHLMARMNCAGIKTVDRTYCPGFEVPLNVGRY